MLLVPHPARAAETFGAGYQAKLLRGGDGTPFRCWVWSGSSDGAGNTYVPCGNNIYRLAPDGRLAEVIPLPAGYPSQRDVAVNARGNVLWYVVGNMAVDIPDPLGIPHLGSIARMVRGSDGVWRRDTSFTSGPYTLGAWRWSARNIDVDLAGNLYATVNAFVYVLDGATGRIKRTFGGDVSDPVSKKYIAGLEVAEGIAVTGDGRSVYVVEQRRNHVERWDYDATHDAWNRSNWIIGSTTRVSDCVDTTSLASPYDVALDGRGSLYVMDTTCRRLLRYDRITRAHTGTIWRNYPVGDGEDLYHGIAVNFRGDVTVAEHGRRYVSPSLPVRCLPDSDFPRVTGLGSPSTVWDATMPITIGASDGCSKVVAVRVRGDIAQGGWIWKNYPSVRQQILLSGGDGLKQILVDARDTYGRVGTRTFVIRLDRSQPPLKLRSRISIPGRARRCVRRPLRQLRNRSSWRVLDRCVTLQAKVIQIHGSGKSQAAYVELPLATSQKIWSNARRPVRIWVMSSGRTRRVSPPTVGRPLLVTGALVAHRRTNQVAVYPVGLWRGL